MANEKGYVPIWSGHPDPFPVSLSVSLFNDSYKATLGNISQEFLEGKLKVSVIPLIFQEKFLLYTKQMSGSLHPIYFSLSCL
ncbi:hypothetical protein CWI39_2100p0010 [Hamiltosporidium magnivora]|uniref:Uncharacterized protein n=1 Tax=Hamiltosporidium magnivora TaxID=148818 RepID=A0A4Q9KWE2_9MICR|nr:hypothetical protein CWI39_2100p0010 [Hamiltosporidium magnivora]